MRGRRLRSRPKGVEEAEEQRGTGVAKEAVVCDCEDVHVFQIVIVGKISSVCACVTVGVCDCGASICDCA